MNLKRKTLLALTLFSSALAVAHADVNIDFKCNSVGNGLLFGEFSNDTLIPHPIDTKWLSINNSNWNISSLGTSANKKNFSITGAMNVISFTADEFYNNHIQIDIVDNSTSGSCKAVKTATPLKTNLYIANKQQQITKCEANASTGALTNCVVSKYPNMAYKGVLAVDKQTNSIYYPAESAVQGYSSYGALSGIYQCANGKPENCKYFEFPNEDHLARAYSKVLNMKVLDNKLYVYRASLVGNGYPNIINVCKLSNGVIDSASCVTNKTKELGYASANFETAIGGFSLVKHGDSSLAYFSQYFGKCWYCTYNGAQKVYFDQSGKLLSEAKAEAADKKDTEQKYSNESLWQAIYGDNFYQTTAQGLQKCAIDPAGSLSNCSIDSNNTDLVSFDFSLGSRLAYSATADGKIYKGTIDANGNLVESSVVLTTKAPRAIVVVQD